MKKNLITIIMNAATLVGIIVTLVVFITRIDARSVKNQEKDIEQDVIILRHEERITAGEVERATFHATITEQYKSIIERLDEVRTDFKEHVNSSP